MTIKKQLNFFLTNLIKPFFLLKEFRIGSIIIHKKNINTFADNTTFSSGHIVDPHYISGLTQADGSFFCSIEKTINKNQQKGLKFKPIFDITTDLDSKHTLDMIQSYFTSLDPHLLKTEGKIGTVTIKISDHTARFRVANKKDLINIIIPHFKKYPVVCNKLFAFNLFIQILENLSKKNKDRDLKLLLSLAISMNKSSRRSDTKILELSNLLGLNETPKKLPELIPEMNSELTPGFLAGMIDGDGSFNITFPQKINSAKIKPVLSLCLGSTALILKNQIKLFLGPSGVLYKDGSIYILKFSNLDHLLEFVIPFIESNPLYTEKKEHFQIWKEVCFILKKENPLSKKSFLKIVDLSYDMNKKGKRRKIIKEEYIKLINTDYIN